MNQRLDSLLYIFSIFTFIMVSSVHVGLAQDWPQLLGPNRDGVAKGESLMDPFPTKLDPLWSQSVGSGYAGPVIENGKVYIFHRVDNDQLVQCLSLNDGKVQWTSKLPASDAVRGMDSDDGPMATPVICGDKIVLFDRAGNLFCVNKSNGQAIWNCDTMKKFRAGAGYFGFGCTPLIIEDTIILNVGGRDAGVVGIELETGNTKWQVTDERASYSSPIAFPLPGNGNSKKMAAAVVTRLKFVLIDPDKGAVIAETPFGRSGTTVNGAMPCIVAGGLLLNSSYGVGSTLVKYNSGRLDVVWSRKDRQAFASQYSTPVVFEGRVFGSSGREDMRDGSYCCVDPLTGKKLWSKAGIPVGHSILVEDKILLLDCTGVLHVIKADANTFKSIAKLRVFQSAGRCIPALSVGRLVVRNNAQAGQGKLVCLQVGR